MPLTKFPGNILGVGFNPLQAPNAPTIGTATGGDTTASVAFTAPANIGGSAITGYVVQSTPSNISATGSSSPITVSGLTNGTAYTFRVTALNSYGPSPASAASNSVTPAIVQGQQAYTTPGTYSWVAPAGVTSVSVVCVGGGGGADGNAAGSGGALAYVNNYSVTPGQSYSVIVGAAGTPSSSGGQSRFVASNVCAANGGVLGLGAAGGTVNAGTGGSGGSSGLGPSNPTGGGGAGGYSGAGGNGAQYLSDSSAGSGGGGGGGGSPSGDPDGNSIGGGGGGGVGLLGQGSNGFRNIYANPTFYNGGGGGSGGGGGEGGFAGQNLGLPAGGNGGSPGGGAGWSPDVARNGGTGAVRIIWPGTTRQFPSTNTGNV